MSNPNLNLKTEKNKATTPTVESLNCDEEILMGENIEIPPNAKVIKEFHFD